MSAQNKSKTSSPPPSRGAAVETEGLPEEAHAQRMAGLFKDEYTKVVGYLVTHTGGSWSEACDIAAEAFAKVLETKDHRTISFFRAYVYRTAHNIATDRARLKAIRGRILEDASHEFDGEEPSPEPGLCEVQRAVVLQRVLAELNPRWRMAIRLRYWDELSCEEIVDRFLQKNV